VFKKNIFKRRLSLLTSLSFLSAVLISTTACSKLPDKTVNPFWSSFEQNDPKAEDNQKYSPTSGISNLSTTTSSGPISGYNLNAHTNDLRGYGFNGLKTFYYEAQANPDQEIFFENLIYDNLHIKVGKNTELSYKIFPTLGDENLPNVNQRYLSSYIAIDLIYTNKENDRDPRRLSLDSRAIDQDGIHMDAYNQGLSKTLYCNQ
jgi:hypothetical protein